MVKGYREQNDSLNIVAVNQGLEETHYPYHASKSVELDSGKWQERFAGS